MAKEISMTESAKQAAHSYTATVTDPRVVVSIETGEFPYEPQMQRVILDVPPIYDLLGIEEVKTPLLNAKDIVEFRKKGSTLSIPESQLKSMVQDISTQLVEATVMAVGNLKELDLHPGNKVMVFINQLESSIKVNDKEYRVYAERCIILKKK